MFNLDHINDSQAVKRGVVPKAKPLLVTEAISTETNRAAKSVQVSTSDVRKGLVVAIKREVYLLLARNVDY